MEKTREYSHECVEDGALWCHDLLLDESKGWGVGPVGERVGQKVRTDPGMVINCKADHCRGHRAQITGICGTA
jgi:hypothetical protein